MCAGKVIQTLDSVGVNAEVNASGVFFLLIIFNFIYLHNILNY